jgi:tetratricopeptide (TPR) repeat protein
MRGVARLLLARASSENRAADYRLACADLEESGTLGDNSLEHDQYLIEAYLHLYDAEPDSAILDKGGRQLSESLARHQSRILHFLNGEVALHRGFMKAKVGQSAEALKEFEQALTSFEACQQHPPDEALSDDYLAMKKGHAALRICTTRHVVGIPPEMNLLDSAIEDLRAGGDSLAPALLLRSIELRRNGKDSDALRDLQEALRICHQHPESPESEVTAARVMSGIAECNIRLGLESSNAALIGQGCAEFLSLPIDLAEANVAAPIYGARFLLSDQLETSRDLVDRIVSNIEMRLGTNALAGAPRRFAASHAAALLILKTGGEPSLDVYERANRLQQIAISASSELADAELYGTTGSTALLIGRELLRLDEVQRGVGFLEDAAELFELATRQALDGRCSEGFSMVVAHSKMGETYTRLHALSNDETHAELAIRHFRRAQELGNSTAELTGMLGASIIARAETNWTRHSSATPLSLRPQPERVATLRARIEACLRRHTSCCGS